MDTRELDPKIKIRAPLRCDGVGSLDCAENTESGVRMAVRWLPLEANGLAAAKAMEGIPVHPVLPRIHSTGQVGSSAFVVMEFPEGRLLSTMLDTPLQPETLARVGAEVAEALAALHAQNVVHGELSADSVLMLPDGRVILWDVPLVLANRVTDRRGEERALSQLIRVAPYLSPERARGNAADIAGDLYALGALLCLAGGSPLPPGASTLAVVHQIASGQWRPEVPRAAAVAVRECLARMIDADPAARPDARSVAAELMSVVSQTRTLPEMAAVVAAPSAPAPTAEKQEPAAEPVDAAEPKDAPEPVDAAEPKDAPESMEAAESVEAPEPVPAIEPGSLPPPLPPRAPAPSPTVTQPTIPEQSIVLEPELEAQAQALRAESRRRAMIGAGIAATVLVGVALAAFAFSGSTESDGEAVSTEVAAPQPSEVEEEVEENVSDLLAPLVDGAPRRKPAKKVVQRRPAAANPAEATPDPAPDADPDAEAAAEGDASDIQPASGTTPATTVPADFGFLPQNVPAPTTELKRPSL